MFLLLEVRTFRGASCLHTVRTSWLRTGWLRASTSRHFHRTNTVTKKKTHYERLGLKNNATQGEIKAAYLKISKEIHPDVNPGDPHTQEKFVRLNQAYTVLSSVLARRDYDTTLARRIIQQQKKAQTMHGSHTPGSSHSPGSKSAKPGYDDDDAEPFYDETLWHMRDKSKDHNAFYPEDSYYGVKGVSRMPNRVGLIGCGVIMVMGMVGFWVALRFSRNKVKEVRRKVDQVNIGYLQEAKARARQHGNARQLEIMAAKFEIDSQARAESLKDDDK